MFSLSKDAEIRAVLYINKAYTFLGCRGFFREVPDYWGRKCDRLRAGIFKLIAVSGISPVNVRR